MITKYLGSRVCGHGSSVQRCDQKHFHFQPPPFTWHILLLIMRQKVYLSRESYLSKKFQLVLVFVEGAKCGIIWWWCWSGIGGAAGKNKLHNSSSYPPSPSEMWVVEYPFQSSIIDWCCLFICHLQHLFVMSCLLTSFHHHHCHHYVDHKDAVSWDL